MKKFEVWLPMTEVYQVEAESLSEAFEAVWAGGETAVYTDLDGNTDGVEVEEFKYDFPTADADVSAYVQMQSLRAAIEHVLAVSEDGSMSDIDFNMLREALKGGSNKIEVPLNVFDAEGNVVLNDEGDDVTRTAELTIPQVADIVDHAAQLILVGRGEEIVDPTDILANLEEALVVSGVLAE